MPEWSLRKEPQKRAWLRAMLLSVCAGSNGPFRLSARKTAVLHGRAKRRRKDLENPVPRIKFKVEMRKTKATNEELRVLILELKRQKEPVFKRLAGELARPARSHRVVNLSRIDVHTKVGEVAVVPGKVLGSGKLTKKITIAAWRFSEGAKELIKISGGSAMSFNELIKKKPKNMRIIG